MNLTKKALIFALILASLTAPEPVRAEVEKGEPNPYTRPFYLRGLAGFIVHNRMQPTSDSAAVFGFGGEIGFNLFSVTENSEFSSIGLGFHYDTYALEIGSGSDRQNTMLGQIIFIKHTEDFAGYFGPEFGVRSFTADDGTYSASGLVAGIFGGIEIPLTTHLSYGPQLHLNHAFPTKFTHSVSGDMVEQAFVLQAMLAVSYRP